MVGQVSVRSKSSGIGWEDRHATKHTLAQRVTAQTSTEVEPKRSKAMMSRQEK